MNFIQIIVIVLAAAFLVSRFMPVKGITNITTIDLKRKLTEKSVQFIDVRTPGEYGSNHIKQFKNIPLNQLSANTSGLSKDKEVVVICHSGMRSAQASKRLKRLGFKHITNVKGGMSAWN